MKRSVVTALLAAALTAGSFAGTGVSSAATATADLVAYRLPPSPGSKCTIGVTNLGPDTVDVNIAPSNLFEKVYIRILGPLAPGKSAKAEYTFACQALESDKVLFLVALGYSGGEQANDPNFANNAVPFVYGEPAPGAFGSS